MKEKSVWLVLLLVAVLFPSMAIAGMLVVKSGDTLGRIAKDKGISVAELVRVNGIIDRDKIRIGQKLEIPEKGIRRIVQKQSVAKGGSGYKHTYLREMGNPFSLPPKDGKQRKFSSREFERHLSNIMKHGVSREGARAILAAKENNISAGEVFLPNGTIVKSVSFGRNEVWTGGVLINVKAGGIKAIKYRGWTGEIILDALNCGNYINPREVYVPPGVPYIPVETIEVQDGSMPTEEDEPTQKIPCQNCKDELEIDSGIYLSSTDSTRGMGFFGEMLFWRNFDKESCSSEYWWGVGALASGYVYDVTDSSAGGKGYRLAAQAGIKRVWLGGEKLLARQWIIKARLGLEKSHWENSDHDWSIDQVGPVAGVYAEYRHELVFNKLWWFATVETWLGLGNQSVDSSFTDTKPDNRAFLEALVGVDYKFSKNWIWRNYAGLDLTEDFIPGVGGTELRYKVPKGWGTLAFGIQMKLYATINPTWFLYGKWEITEPIERWHDNCRQESVQYVGTGIGINQIRKVASAQPTDNNMSTSSNRMDAVVAGLGSNSLK